MTVKERTNIHDPIVEICERLGIDVNQVLVLTVEPDKVEAVLTLTNENGKKYVGEDGYLAKETLIFYVLA